MYDTIPTGFGLALSAALWLLIAVGGIMVLRRNKLRKDRSRRETYHRFFKSEIDQVFNPKNNNQIRTRR